MLLFLLLDVGFSFPELRPPGYLGVYASVSYSLVYDTNFYVSTTSRLKNKLGSSSQENVVSPTFLLIFKSLMGMYFRANWLYNKK